MNKKFIRIISLLTAILMVFSLCACTAATDDEEEEIKYASAVPATKAEIVDRFNAVIASADASNPAISYGMDQKARGADCENSNLKAAFKTVADWITDEGFGQETAYGEDATNILPANGTDKIEKLLVSDIRSAYVTDNKADKTYTIIININGEEDPEQDGSIYGKFYKIDKDEEILANFDVVKDVMTVEDYDATYGVGTIKATIDKATDHILKLELSREVKVETAVTGVGTLASIGENVPLTFDYSSTENFSFDWDNPETKDVVEA